MPAVSPSRAQRQMTLHEVNGAKLPVDIYDFDPDVEDGKVEYKLLARFSPPHNVNSACRYLLRGRFATGESVSAVLVTDLNWTVHDSEHRLRISALQVPMEPGEQEAIERWHNREAIIQEGIDTYTTLTALWEWLKTRVPTSELIQVQDAIIAGRAQRQREAQEREMRERHRQQLEEDNRRNRLEAERLRLAEERAAYPRDVTGRFTSVGRTEQTKRRLSGGTDLSKPKKRKIDLGE